MAASVSGAKTASTDVDPICTGAKITTLFAKAIENCTVADIIFLDQCLNKVAGGEDPNKTIGALFS